MNTPPRNTHRPVLGTVLKDVLAAVLCYGLPLTGFFIALRDLGDSGRL